MRGNCQKFLKSAQKVKKAQIFMRPKKKRPATSQKRPLCAIAQCFGHTGNITRTTHERNSKDDELQLFISSTNQGKGEGHVVDLPM